MAIEIRYAREAELDEMIELQCLVFRPDGHERYHQYIHGDPSYRLEQTRIVAVDGRIAATLRIWDRSMRVSATPVRMAGIGGVCTHPDFRGRGYASQMLRDACDYMRAEGYLMSVLFSEIPMAFYRRFGWGSVPMSGFRLTNLASLDARAGGGGEWEIGEFDEYRDLEQVMALHEAFNARQSASLLRSSDYWKSAPSRLRGVLPTAVARRGQELGGYVNMAHGEQRLEVLEVAYEMERNVLSELADFVLLKSAQSGVRDIVGDMPHGSPLVTALQERSDGDLYVTGNSAMMIRVMDLQALITALLPELNSRLEREDLQSPPFRLAIGDESCTLAPAGGGLCVVDHEGDAEALPRSVDELSQSGEILRHSADVLLQSADTLRLSGEVLWRLLLGESSWSEVDIAVREGGISLDAGVSRLMAALFPRQSPIFWAPDHY